MVQATSSAAGRSKWPRMSYEEYLDDLSIPEATEWVDGEVIGIPPVSLVHARLVSYLTGLLGAYLEQRPVGELFALPFNMQPDPALPGRAPDLLIVLNEHADLVTSKNVQGPADVVVEVIDPETQVVDRGQKFYEYERGGVGEYWLLDPARRVAAFYRRGRKDVFRLAGTDASEYESPCLPGLRMHADWLWSRRPVREIMRELRLDD